MSINRNHMGKTLHLTVEVHNGLIKGLVDTGASMSMMAAIIVWELGIMHLVSKDESYKIACGIITKALSRIMDIPLKVGNVQCDMVFFIVDIDSYDVFLGLDFLMKIGTVVDVENGVIQVWNGPGVEVELLPLTKPVGEQKLLGHVQVIVKGIQGLSLMKQPHIPNNPNDDHEYNSNMKKFGSEVEDDHNKILHEKKLFMEDLMDQGLDDLIKEEAPTQIVN